MNAYVVGHWHLFRLKEGGALRLDINSPSLIPHNNKSYNRVLWFEGLRIYIEGSVVITEQVLRTDDGCGGDGEAYVIKDIDLVKTRDGKLALVSAQVNGDMSVFIGNTVNAEYFNATICGEVKDGQDYTDDDDAFAELNNGCKTTVVHSERGKLNTCLNDEGKSAVMTEYQVLVAVIRNDTIIRNGTRKGGYAYFYTHNLDGEFVVAWIDGCGDVLIEHIEGRLKDSYAYFISVPDDGCDCAADEELVGAMLGDDRWRSL